MTDGKYKLKSFNNNNPTILQSEQFTVLAIVNGRGIDAADFVAITFFTAASGDAKRMIYIEWTNTSDNGLMRASFKHHNTLQLTYIKTPSLPTISAADALGSFDTINVFNSTIHVTTTIC